MIKFLIYRKMLEHAPANLVLKVTLIALANEEDVAIRSKDGNDKYYYYKFDNNLQVWRFNEERNEWLESNRNMFTVITSFDGLLYQIEESKWYDSIPKQGVLCHVQAEPHESFTRVRLVFAYDPATKIFTGDCHNYYNAIPLTAEDVSHYILGE